MKSVITAAADDKFPMMKQLIGDPRLVVLFVNEKVGVVVASDKDLLDQVGDYSVNWAPTKFERFTGRVTLSN